MYLAKARKNRVMKKKKKMHIICIYKKEKKKRTPFLDLFVFPLSHGRGRKKGPQIYFLYTNIKSENQITTNKTEEN